jgi:hypothetical protein
MILSSIQSSTKIFTEPPCSEYSHKKDCYLSPGILDLFFDLLKGAVPSPEPTYENPVVLLRAILRGSMSMIIRHGITAYG